MIEILIKNVSSKLVNINVKVRNRYDLLPTYTLDCGTFNKKEAMDLYVSLIGNVEAMKYTLTNMEDS